ncbi:MAG: FAD-dependent oxidoreductase [Deltaproteobacteria bacterium]|nr:FAD-dependent oxidoreductase [Deltaproteobacteria bacterium]
MTVKGRLIIIGSGIAGISAARAARRTYPHIDITLISEDRDGFYNRIAVGALAVEKRREVELFTLAPNCFENDRVSTRFGESVSKLDVARKTVHLTHGATLPYDRLILATGASPSVPSIPGINHRAVHYLWNLDDARRLAAQLKTAQNVAVIGGGILGVEAALDMAAMGKKVHLIEAADGLLKRHLPASISSTLKDALAQSGISVYTRALVNDVHAQGDSLSIRTTSVTITCTAVLVSAGVRSNTELANAAGIQIDNGIVVNNRMRTNVPDVLACGNCIQQPQGGALLWNPAKAQGETAGENAFEDRQTFRRQPYPIHLKSTRISLFAMGAPETVPRDAICIQEKTASGEKRIFVRADGTICYAVFWGDVTGYYAVEKLFRNNVVIDSSIIREGRVSRITRDVLRQPDDAGYLTPGWVCSVCGYIHEGDTAPGVCPVCNVGRDQFLAA